MRVIQLTILGLLLTALGCAGGEWARVRAEDTPGAYRRFLRENPDSRHVAEARERLDYLQLRRSPDAETFERFRNDYPNSIYLAELEAQLEEPLFEAALQQGTGEAYERFLQRFPNGSFAERARANYAYFEIGGAFAPPEKLLEFYEQHPESDYAEEVQRTLTSLSLRDTTRIRSTGLRIEIDPSTPGGDRLATRFRDLALATYRAAGLRLVPADGSARPNVDAWLTISHGEAAVATQVSNGQVSRPGLLATTEVTLQRAGAEQPFWSETFTLRTSELDRRGGSSILLSASARPYWANFFVPVATWRTSAARRPALRFSEEAVAVDVRGTRAAALFPDGSFQLLNVSDPSRPRVIFEYAHPRDLKRFTGIHLGGDRIALFGDDGLEILAIEGGKLSVVREFDRNGIGAVRAAIRHGNDLLVGGTRGLVRVSLVDDAVETLLGKSVRDLDLEGDRILLVDEERLYVGRLGQIRRGQAEAQFRLGKDFDATRVRLSGRLGLVLSPRGLLALDLSVPTQPRKLTWLRPSDSGVVHDAAILGDRVFLVGNRGLQVLDPRSGRIFDSVDVDGRSRVARAGRFLVTVGADALEVVDATPWTTKARWVAPASAASTRGAGGGAD